MNSDNRVICLINQIVKFAYNNNNNSEYDIFFLAVVFIEFIKMLYYYFSCALSIFVSL